MNLENRIKLSDPNGYYGTPFRYWISNHLPRMIYTFCPIENARILDLGCGQRQYAELFKSLSISEVYMGIDLKRKDNWDNIKENEQLHILFKHHNADTLQSLDDSFNFIYLLLQHLNILKIKLL